MIDYKNTKVWADSVCTPESSKAIHSVGYDYDTRTLYVKFKASVDDVYLYDEVDSNVFDGFLYANSAGRYYVNEVKGRYTSTLYTDFALDWIGYKEDVYEPVEDVTTSEDVSWYDTGNSEGPSLHVEGNKHPLLALGLEPDVPEIKPGRSLTAPDAPTRVDVVGFLIVPAGQDITTIEVTSHYYDSTSWEARDKAERSASELGLSLRVTQVVEYYD